MDWRETFFNQWRGFFNDSPSEYSPGESLKKASRSLKSTGEVGESHYLSENHTDKDCWTINSKT